MNARGSVFGILIGDAVLRDDLGVETVYASGSVDTPQENRFVILRWETSDRAFGVEGRDRLLVWVHDRTDDYGPVDLALNRCRDLLQAAVHVSGADGVTLSQADWYERSGDLRDGGYHTVTRWDAYTVVGRTT